jgi:hypothetical protein
MNERRWVLDKIGEEVAKARLEKGTGRDVKTELSPRMPKSFPAAVEEQYSPLWGCVAMCLRFFLLCRFLQRLRSPGRPYHAPAATMMYVRERHGTVASRSIWHGEKGGIYRRVPLSKRHFKYILKSSGY